MFSPGCKVICRKTGKEGVVLPTRCKNGDILVRMKDGNCYIRSVNDVLPASKEARIIYGIEIEIEKT